MGRREDGSSWLPRLFGTRVLVVGMTETGKESVIRSTFWTTLLFLADGTAQVRAIEPKRMEPTHGKDLFAHYADDGESAVASLERAVADRRQRAEHYVGEQRSHIPTTDDPFVVVLLDEVAFLRLGRGHHRHG